jgi:hypothetical protein
MAVNYRPRGSVAEQGQAVNAVAVTAHVSDPVSSLGASAAIMVNVAGDIACRFESASSDVTLTLLAGVVYPFRISHIRATGTTATGITAFY